ncbi:MAG TPA: XRE family transcriptional regulator [Burkholderiales bacterium]|jgi:predicted XRE-type DNA-binding protein|nr:XRE family transcriptional regulator [Burkholderiales bacterium]
MKTAKKTRSVLLPPVADAIEVPAGEAESMKLRSRLMLAVQDRVHASGAPQSQSAKRLGISLPHFLELMDGRIDLFTVEALVDMAVRLGMKIELRVKPLE